MPDSSQRFTITNGDASPNGNGAAMSRTGSNSKPNQGYWFAADADYTVLLPVAVWNATANDPGGTKYQFSVTRNSNSATVSLRTDAPLGTQDYQIQGPPTPQGGNSQPNVVVDP